jgi:hypothetical protein
MLFREGSVSPLRSSTIEMYSASSVVSLDVYTRLQKCRMAFAMYVFIVMVVSSTEFGGILALKNRLCTVRTVSLVSYIRTDTSTTRTSDLNTIMHAQVMR